MRRSPKEWARQTREAVEFHLHPPVWNEVLQGSLSFGEHGNEAFRSMVYAGESYLEFGAGASTIWATNECPIVTTVESDAHFLAAVERKCSRGNTTELRLIHADIGKTGPWGKPIFPMLPRPQTWRIYPKAPWEYLGEDYRADSVLVDGRFRVACALAVVVHQSDSDWIMLVDDFVGRTHYEPIKEFAELRGIHGRMARFGPARGISRADAIRALEYFVSDWR